MKKVILMSLAAGLLFTAQSCKKGENDPFLALKSRDARVAGEWKLTSQDMVQTSTETFEGTTVTESYTTKFDGTVVTETDTYDGETDTYTYSYSQTIEINKDGSYKMTSVADGDTDTETGSWWWISDAKKKTRIAFDDDANSFEIDMLKSKEMTWVISQESSYSGSGYSSTDIFSGTMTFEKN
jgi:hypothetical protein